MRRDIATLLRQIAQHLDPLPVQPKVVELLQVSNPDEGSPQNFDIIGSPVYYWKTGDNSFSVWPRSLNNIKLCYKV